MSKKKNKENMARLEFIGNNTVEVTGSSMILSFEDSSINKTIHILIECGMSQSSTVLNNYNINKGLIEKIDVKNLDYLILLDPHTDHAGNTPQLVSKSKTFKIITTPANKYILPIMWMDGAFINENDSKWLKDRRGVKAKPLFSTSNVVEAEGLIETLEYNKMFNLSPNIQIRFLKNNHNISSSSLEVFLKDKNSRVHKLYYSSDLGGNIEPLYFTQGEQKPPKSSTVSVYESTYGLRDRTFINKKLRKKELDDLKNMLKYTLIEKKGSCLFPTFSFQRSPQLLMYLYEIMSNDEELNKFNIFLDGNLSNNLLDAFDKICEGKNREYINKILNWENLIRLRGYKETLKFLDQTPKVVLASAGFCHTGRVQLWLKELLPYKRNTIIFSGYSSEGSVASKLKEKETTHQRTIAIDKSKVLINSDVLTLYSFSSHIMRNTLLTHILQTNTSDSIIFVHGSDDAKFELAEDLSKMLNDECLSTKVIIPKKSQAIYF